MKTLTIWDLDGTLTESRPWIIASYSHAAESMGLPVPEGKDLDTIMCGDLYSNVKRMYGLEGAPALEFARHYRTYYNENCFSRVELFDGIREMLTLLKSKGVALAVATMKTEVSAKELLERLGIADLFVMIAGADFEGTRTKCQMIRACISTGDYGKVLMIGDCPSDRRAAEQAGVRFIAASYGYGYPVDKCRKEGIKCIAAPSDICAFL